MMYRTNVQNISLKYAVLNTLHKKDKFVYLGVWTVCPKVCQNLSFFYIPEYKKEIVLKFCSIVGYNIDYN